MRPPAGPVLLRSDRKGAQREDLQALGPHHPSRDSATCRLPRARVAGTVL